MDAIAAEEACQRPKKVVPQVVMKPHHGRGGAHSGGSTRPAKASSSKTKLVDDEDGEAMDLDYEPNNETEEGARPEDEMDIDGGLPVLKTGKLKGKGKGKGKVKIDEDVAPYKKAARGGRKERTLQSEEEGWSEDSDDIRDPTYKPERPNADKSNVEMAEEGEDKVFTGGRSKGSQKVLQKGDKSSKEHVSNSAGSKRIKRKETIRAMVKQHHAQREAEAAAILSHQGGLRSTWQDLTQVEDSRAGIEDAPAERGYAGTSFEYLDGFEDGANDWHERQEEPISAEKTFVIAMMTRSTLGSKISAVPPSLLVVQPPRCTILTPTTLSSKISGVLPHLLVVQPPRHAILTPTILDSKISDLHTYLLIVQPQRRTISTPT
ncbi:hypothetical protein EWM64_g8193, partial [Hericium alpestre]